MEPNFIKAYVQGVLALLIFVREMCANLFLENPLFVQAMKKTSKAIVNSDIDSLSVIDIYAAYCDLHMQVVMILLHFSSDFSREKVMS